MLNSPYITCYVPSLLRNSSAVETLHQMLVINSAQFNPSPNAIIFSGNIKKTRRKSPLFCTKRIKQNDGRISALILTPNYVDDDTNRDGTPDDADDDADREEALDYIDKDDD